MPAGENGIDVVRLDSLIAARHCTAGGAPGEADFKACLAELEADAPALKQAGFFIDASGTWTPTYAYYTFQNETLTASSCDFEVLVSVTRIKP